MYCFFCLFYYQVNDPRAPEWSEYVKGFETWWDNIIKEMITSDDCSISFTPEHGPPNYQICMPYTRSPLADIWDINTFIGKRAQQRFQTKCGLNKSK